MMIDEDTGRIVCDHGLVIRPDLRRGDLAYAEAEQLAESQGIGNEFVKLSFSTLTIGSEEFQADLVFAPDGEIAIVVFSLIIPELIVKHDIAAEECRHRAHLHIINRDLGAQTRFRWGQVRCDLDRKAEHSWLTVIYWDLDKVPAGIPDPIRYLCGREDLPEN
jgi:hypothetical protein